MSTTLIAILAFGVGLAVATAILKMSSSIPTMLVPTDEVFDKVIIKALKNLPEDVIAKREEELKKLHTFCTKDGRTFYEKAEVKEFIAWCLEENRKALKDCVTEFDDLATEFGNTTSDRSE